MRSSFAFILHGFSLPFGAVTGRRLVFDGDQGAIFVYDSNNFQIARIQQDSSNRVFIAADSPSGSRAELEATSTAAFLALDPPDFAGHVIATGSLGGDLDIPSLLTFIAILSPSIDGGAIARAFIRGEDANVHRIPSICFDGGSHLPVNFNVNRRAVPLGMLTNGMFRVSTDDVAQAPGTNTDMAVTVDVEVGRTYRVHLNSAVNFGTAGGVYYVDLHDGTNIVGRFFQAMPAETVAFSTQAYIATTLLYVPAASGTFTLTVRNNVASGGTIQMIRGVNQTRRTMMIEDAGQLADAI